MAPLKRFARRQLREHWSGGFLLSTTMPQRSSAFKRALTVAREQTQCDLDTKAQQVQLHGAMYVALLLGRAVHPPFS